MFNLARAQLYCQLLGAARDHWIHVVPCDGVVEEHGVRISGCLLVADKNWNWCVWSAPEMKVAAA